MSILNPVPAGGYIRYILAPPLYQSSVDAVPRALSLSLSSTTAELLSVVLTAIYPIPSIWAAVKPSKAPVSVKVVVSPAVVVPYTPSLVALYSPLVGAFISWSLLNHPS